MHKYPRFSSEEIRIRTFDSWKKEGFYKEDFVKNGFFYIGGLDTVQCFHCGLLLHSFIPGDNIAAEHLLHNPKCSLGKSNILTPDLLQVVIRLCEQLSEIKQDHIKSQEKNSGLKHTLENILVLVQGGLNFDSHTIDEVDNSLLETIVNIAHKGLNTKDYRDSDVIAH